MTIQPKWPILAERLKDARNSYGITQEELWLRTGIATRTISDIERGLKEKPRLSTLKKLAYELDVSVDYLTGEAR